MGHGGKRKGAGRKPKEHNQKLIERLDNIIDKDAAIQALNDLIAKKDFRAIQLYLNYRYGKPIERVDHTTDGDKIETNILNWVDGGKREV